MDDKRSQIARVAIGAVAAGAERLVIVDEPFRLATGALERLHLDADVDVLRIGASLRAEDTEHAAVRMRAAGCAALVVLGGDGTCRHVARSWPGAPLVAISTGTNNVYPRALEATTAGAAAGLVAAEHVSLDQVSLRSKVAHVDIEDEAPDLALVDAALLEGDFLGNLMPFEPALIRQLVLARAEPDAVGMAAIGGLLDPCGPTDDFGIVVQLGGGSDSNRLLAPISPGLYRDLSIRSVRRLELEQRVALESPGVLALDGDRERQIAPGQRATVSIRRDGPAVIDCASALRHGASAFRGQDRRVIEHATRQIGCC